MEKRIVPDRFHPGEYLRDEIEERGWTPSDFAEILGIERNVVSDIFVGRRSISTELAVSLGQALGTSAQFWLNLQSAYKLAIEQRRDDGVAHRAKLFSLAPVRLMQKRNWIEEVNDTITLDKQICKFYRIKSIDEPIYFSHAARKSDDYDRVTPAQLAWLTRARNLAEVIQVEDKFRDDKLDGLLGEIRLLTENLEDVRRVPRLLAKYGIRFLIVEYLPQTKIDGACFWLDGDSPVIVLSLRHDRIDNFWQSLMHEVRHLQNQDGKEQAILDTAMVGRDAQPFADKPKEEQEADIFAATFLIDPAELEDFIIRVDPYFSRDKIQGFALRLRVHPGIVVGQLQHREIIKYSYFRPLLERVQNVISRSALIDGWGQTV